MNVNQFDPTTKAELAAVTTRLDWIYALRAALGDGYKLVFRRNGTAHVTVTYTGKIDITTTGLQCGTISACTVTAADLTTGDWQMRLESSDGSRWARFNRPITLTNSRGRPLTALAGGEGIDLSAIAITATPPTALTPLYAWEESVLPFVWHEIPNTALTDNVSGTDIGLFAYSGGAMRGLDLHIAGGGHQDSSNNGVYKFPLGVDVPMWVQHLAPTASGSRAADVEYYSDGKPTSRHTYWAIQYVAEHDKLFLMGGNAYGNVPLLNVPNIDACTMSGTPAWDAAGTWPDLLAAAASDAPCCQDGDGRIWMVHNDGQLYRYDCTTMVGTLCGDMDDWGGWAAAEFLYDPVRNRIVCLDRALAGFTNPFYWDLAGYTSGMPTKTDFTLTGALAASISGGLNMEYCPDRDSYIGIHRAETTFTLFEIDPDTFAVTELEIAGSTPVPNSPTTGIDYLYGRFSYVPELHGFVLANRADRNVFFVRIA